MIKSGIFLLKNNEEQGIINEIAKIEAMCFSDSWSISIINQEVTNKNSRWICLYQDNVLVGYGLIWIVAGDCQLLRIAIHPDYRQQGHAKRILEKLIDLAVDESAVSIFLEVRESNSFAINLYEYFGFKQIGVRKGYYVPENEDALLYIKDLMC